MLEMILGGKRTVSLDPGDTGPGPTELIASYARNDTQLAGYYGTVAGSAIGMTNIINLCAAVPAFGTYIDGSTTWRYYNHPSTWLKFHLDGKTLFTPVKPLGSGISWNDLYNLGMVYGRDDIGIPGTDQTGVSQSCIAEFNSYLYRVRLMSISPSVGLTATSTTTLQSPDWEIGSEWVRLFYNIVSLAGLKNQEGDKWASLTPDALGLLSGRAGSGSDLVQNFITIQGTEYAIYSGGGASSGTSTLSMTSRRFASRAAQSMYLMYRPVLELVGKV